MNPLKVRAYSSQRRARLVGASGGFMPSDWQRQYARQGGLCRWCGKAAPLTIDHILPLARGGTHTPANIVLACAACNSAKGRRLVYSEWQPPNPLPLDN
ncbi:MAG: HNH endonuclease [Chloroflexi bacterium]|nr:HNH endonuclease [Chloroflexota bacterium]